MQKYFLIFLFLLLGKANAQEEVDTLRGLQTDIMLHPCDAFTAYTLQKNEFVYNQSPFTLPLPSWAWWGITDRITMEIDLLPLVGGLFVEPHLPVPSLNFRFKLFDSKKWTIAFETMFQHLWSTQNQSNGPTLFVERYSGSSWYNRFNFSWYNQKKLRFHFSAGATYSEKLFISNMDSINFVSKYFNKTFNPDISASLDWRPKPWFSAHLTLSYGTTFVYLDNVPRKYEITYGFRIAPFFKAKWGILRSFRTEFAGLYMYFPDAKTYVTNYFPIFPYFYWQWNMGKKNKAKHPKISAD